jgi:intracellular septation protein A
MALAKYRRRFTVDGTECEVRTAARFTGLYSVLFIAGEEADRDETPAAGPEAIRNHRLTGALPDGSTIEVEAGYISWISVGIAVRRNGELIHESHPGRRIALPESAAKMTVGRINPDGSHSGYDPGQLKRNKVPIMVDVALGLLFFAVAKLTDLSTAAIVGAIAGIALVIAQRFVKVDLLGGLALFGVVLLLVSAGLAMAFEDEFIIKMRSSIVGAISAVLFLGDGLLGGNRLGKALSRYLPYNDLEPGRLAIGMGVLGLVMAALNYLVALFASTDGWLFYSTFVDFFLMLLMIMLVFRYARGQLFPRRAAGEPG